MPSIKKQSTIPIALLGLISALLAIYSPLLLKKVWMVGDTYYAVYSILAKASMYFRNLELPLWMPFLQRGTPLADLLGIPLWSPITIAFSLIGYTDYLLNIQYVFYCMIASCGMYLTLSNFTDDRWLAAAGGVAYGTSGFFVGNAQHITFIGFASIFPLLHYFAYKMLKSGEFPWILLSGVGIGLLLLNSYPPFVIFGLLFLAFDGLFLIIKHQKWREDGHLAKLIKQITLSMMFASCSALVFIASVLKVKDLMVRSRAIPWDDVANNGLSLSNWLGLISPNLVERIPRWTNYLEPSLTNTYISIPVTLVTLASAYSVFQSRRRLDVTYYCLAAAFAITLSTGSGIYKILYQFLYGVNLFRFPGAIRIFAIFYLIIVSTITFEALKDKFANKFSAAILFALGGLLIFAASVMQNGTSLVIEAIATTSILLTAIALVGHLKLPKSIAYFVVVSLFSAVSVYSNPYGCLWGGGRDPLRTSLAESVDLGFSSGSKLVNVKNMFSAASKQGSFNAILNNFDPSGYIGTFELTKYNDAKRRGYKLTEGDPVVWFTDGSTYGADSHSQLKYSQKDNQSNLSINPSVLEVGLNRIAFKAAPRASGFVVLEQNYYPGWRVSVDGVEKMLLETESGVMAVQVDGLARDKEFINVLFEFKPYWTIASIYATSVFWIGVLLYGLIYIKSKTRSWAAIK